ncbi:hypothetical protein OU789_05500 [Halocynthiibacter sp. C4]|uniref:hypothetical protein n=1 Tax=Halocynthiibacter sp. C4 TaxID=2992758 RepID=UPI00237B8916|nr:hypothetical protein [Halocynthiibacter sp. C4]MDE0589373.1 hypothetical protein [Halocynthiibacter sp. C4]
MKNQTLALATCALFLAGCSSVSDSNYNPLNWFDGDSSDQQLEPEEGYVTVTDPRNLIADVRELRIEPTQGGVVVAAMGMPPTQGYYRADLISPTNNIPENGTLTLEFRAAKPPTQQPVSTELSREVWVAYFLSNIELRNIRQIRVVGANNSRTKSKR